MTGLQTNVEAPDFSDPLGLLKACHQRILGFCNLLEKMVVHNNKNGIDSEFKQAAQKIHRYFTTAGILHHMDEEQDLFPLLVGQSLKIAAIINDLKQDHIAMNAAWEKLEPVLAHPAIIEDASEFEQWVNEFCHLYRKHIKTEEEDFLSIAQHMLSSEQLVHLGESMKERRGKGRI